MKATFDENMREKYLLLEEMIIKKQKDYGPKNIMLNMRSLTPLHGVLLRLNDKVARLDNLLATGVSPENESLIDTAMDIANYGVILWAVLDGSFELPLKENVIQKSTKSNRKRVANNALRNLPTSRKSRTARRR